MTATPQITILMATYNGSEYITEQLDSLLAQTYDNWQLIIRDDGSSDNTVAIVQKYMDTHPHIFLTEKKSAIQGACANFSVLFDIAFQDKAMEYIMFCDQDDIWKPEKLQITMTAMQAMERESPDEPVLIYGNFELVDAYGAFMPGAFKLKHQVHLRNLLSFNFVYGCTTMLNRALIERIEAIPTSAINHDYWIALVASIYQSRFINAPLLRYRQHGNNASGNVAGNSSIMARIKRNFTNPDKELDNLEIRLRMFANFYNKYQNEMNAGDKKMLTRFLEAFRSGRLQVGMVMLRNRIFRNGLLQTLALFFQVFFFFGKIKSPAGQINK